MAKTKIRMKEFDSSVIPYFLKFPQNHYWVDYDEETATLQNEERLNERI